MSHPTDAAAPEFDFLSCLPLDIAINILSMLDAQSLLMASRVNRAWLSLSREALLQAHDYRDTWWLDAPNWKHLSQLSAILADGGSEVGRDAVQQRNTPASDTAREEMLLEVGRQLEEMRLKVRGEWKRLEVDISAQLELDPWCPLQPDVFIGLLKNQNKGPAGAVRPRDA
ncbi:uncharacterized protein LOC126456181 [Schistocerca serialis cubense]|uniref:uncharacterized protein LOC126456181 n=1 Tax=Schistocerca serialis cubense TaxID=2023355 RepID=UPI00214E1BBA|nr:uncharacterized protein LOC126456181 [Schistocerca serialis cubense]